MTSRHTLETAARAVYSIMPPTPQIRWPLLCERLGCDAWIKHENHTAVGSFKLRGSAFYLSNLLSRSPRVRGVVAATTGNFGQGITAVARQLGLAAVIVAPEGNNRDKSASMRAFGAELIEHGDDFDECYEHALELAAERDLHMAPSFHSDLVLGVASYGLELFRQVNDLDAVYVPIGQGSGICGVMAARDALERKTEIIGVVSERLPTYALSFARGEPVPTPPATTIADGTSVKVPVPEALDLIRRGVSRVLTVSEEAIKDAMRFYFSDTHNVAEGAGAVALAGLVQERERRRGQRVAVVLSGGNVDRQRFGTILLDGAAEQAGPSAALTS